MAFNLKDGHLYSSTDLNCSLAPNPQDLWSQTTEQRHGNNYEGLLKLFNLVPQLSEPGPVITTEPPRPQQQKPHFSPQGSGPGPTTTETAPGSLDGLGGSAARPKSRAGRGPRRSRRSEAGLGGRGGYRAGRASGRSRPPELGLGEGNPGPGKQLPRRPAAPSVTGSPLAPAQDRAAWGGRKTKPSFLCGRRGGPTPGTRRPAITHLHRVRSAPTSPLRGLAAVHPAAVAPSFKSERRPVRAAPPSRPLAPPRPHPRAVHALPQNAEDAERRAGSPLRHGGGGGRAGRSDEVTVTIPRTRWRPSHALDARPAPGGRTRSPAPVTGCLRTHAAPVTRGAGAAGRALRPRPRHRARGGGEPLWWMVSLPWLCVLPAMEAAALGFSPGTWLPSRAEWLLAVRSIQPEEKERIGQFVFARTLRPPWYRGSFALRVGEQPSGVVGRAVETHTRPAWRPARAARGVPASLHHLCRRLVRRKKSNPPVAFEKRGPAKP